MITKTVRECRLALTHNYSSGETSGTMAVAFSTDNPTVPGGHDYSDVALTPEATAFLLGEIAKAKTAMATDVFQVADARLQADIDAEEEARRQELENDGN